MNQYQSNPNELQHQPKQQLYTVEYVHYLEQSVMDLTERILVLEEELKQLKQSVCFFILIY